MNLSKNKFKLNAAFIVVIIESTDSISRESISRDEPDSPKTQYITNAGISHARYTHFKPAEFQSNECITLP